MGFFLYTLIRNEIHLKAKQKTHNTTQIKVDYFVGLRRDILRQSALDSSPISRGLTTFIYFTRT